MRYKIGEGKRIKLQNNAIFLEIDEINERRKIGVIEDDKYITKRDKSNIMRKFHSVGISKDAVDKFLRDHINTMVLIYEREEGYQEIRQEPIETWVNEAKVPPKKSYGGFEDQYHRAINEWGLNKEGSATVRDGDQEVSLKEYREKNDIVFDASQESLPTKEDEEEKEEDSFERTSGQNQLDNFS